MKICKNCFREFDEREIDIKIPISKLGEIFLEQTTDVNPDDYCPECREELGIMNIAGFDHLS